ncbi:hypothetical protein [Kitasatospora purpeofusca]|uniref:hypothetical protein n=1 Tax=Kitasatospora purpeofusca TaxID=67352 RepID=UPI00224E21E3|nr:hypothetical protein [Kitasatospora purpeofusca]MCX4752918.1 hypothetical protein [Kitasatospora purpeofusca]WSR32461.1 hypothetical protein OG715_16595 [Kitasatospora purpeofusca]WSR40549.1 hypothetical protein OG196_16380 [Kitasatospora purpeofusca]
MDTCLSCNTLTQYGAYLCRTCTVRTDGYLRELPGLYEVLEDWLRPSSQVSTAVGTRSASPDAPMPVAEEVLDIRGPGGMVTVLEQWRQAWCEDAGIRWPAPFGTYRGRLLRVVRALREQLPAMAQAWPEAGQFVDEVREHHAAALSIVDPRGRTVRAGNCTAKMEGEVCGAVLRAVPGVPEIRCAWCSTTYPPSTWLGLAEVA